MDYLRLLIIMNPHASAVSHFSEAGLRHFIQQCLASTPSVRYQILFTHEPSELRETLRQHLKQGDVDRVVVGGGDGTIGEVLPVMIEVPHIPVALLPMGTGNLLATNLKIPADLEDALQIAIHGKTKPIDLAMINGRFFVLNASIGIDAEIMARTHISMKQRWGRLAYFITGLPLLPYAQHAAITIETDRQTICTRAVGITISNAGGKIPGGIKISPAVQADDGLLHGTIFKLDRWYDYVIGFFQLLFSIGRKREKSIQYFTAQVIRVIASPPLKTQADGNVVGETPASIEIVPQKLQMMVPVERL